MTFLPLFRNRYGDNKQESNYRRKRLWAPGRQRNEFAANFKVYFPRAYLPEHDWERPDENSVLTQLQSFLPTRPIVKEILA